MSSQKTIEEDAARIGHETIAGAVGRTVRSVRLQVERGHFPAHWWARCQPLGLDMRHFNFIGHGQRRGEAGPEGQPKKSSGVT